MECAQASQSAAKKGRGILTWMTPSHPIIGLRWEMERGGAVLCTAGDREQQEVPLSPALSPSPSPSQA